VNAFSPALAGFVEAGRIDLACGGSYGVTATFAGRVRCRVERETSQGGARDVAEFDLSPDECREIARRYLRAAEEADEAILRACCPDLLGLSVGSDARATADSHSRSRS
jgi:hypothetical protein